MPSLHELPTSLATPGAAESSAPGIVQNPSVNPAVLPGTGSVSPEAAAPDYGAIGRERLAKLGLGSYATVAVTTGDAEGKCVGRFDEAVGRHDFVHGLAEDATVLAKNMGKTVEDIIGMTSLRRALMKDDTGGYIHIPDGQDPKDFFLDSVVSNP